MTFIVWLLLDFVVPLSGLSYSRSHGGFLQQPKPGNEGKLLCRVTPKEDAMSGGRKLDVWQLPGNARAVSFEDALTYESLVSCAGPSPECEHTEAEVFDVQDCPPCPCELELQHQILESQQALVSAIQPRCTVARAGRPFDILMLGLGGGIVHTFVHTLCPQDTRVRSVEIDARFAAVASRYFGLPLQSGLSEVVVGDALNVVRDEAARLNKNSSHPTYGEEEQDMGANGWDAVVVDCFVGGGRTAPACRSEEMVKDLNIVLKPGGIVMQHVWHRSPKDTHVASEFKSTMKNYEKVFRKADLQVQPVYREDPAWRLDDVIMATKSQAQS
jgi:hypothetical protein